MKRIFEYPSYKEFIVARVKAMPKKGFGQFRKIAQTLRIHTTRISQIVHGPAHFTPEQSAALCRYFGMNQLEAEYFLALVELERSGTEELREHIKAKMTSLRERAAELVHRVPRERVLSEPEQAVFYSTWQYPALHLATMIDEYKSIDALSARFSLPREKVRQILDFLLSTGLCVKDKKGKFEPGTRLTHLERSSPLIVRHHANWRLKAMQRQENLGTNDLSYSAPAVVSGEDQKHIRELAAQFVENFLKVVKNSKPDQKLAFLNIDWLEM